MAFRGVAGIGLFIDDGEPINLDSGIVGEVNRSATVSATEVGEALSTAPAVQVQGLAQGGQVFIRGVGSSCCAGSCCLICAE